MIQNENDIDLWINKYNNRMEDRKDHTEYVRINIFTNENKQKHRDVMWEALENMRNLITSDRFRNNQERYISESMKVAYEKACTFYTEEIAPLVIGDVRNLFVNNTSDEIILERLRQTINSLLQTDKSITGGMMQKIVENVCESLNVAFVSQKELVDPNTGKKHKLDIEIDGNIACSLKSSGKDRTLQVLWEANLIQQYDEKFYMTLNFDKGLNANSIAKVFAYGFKTLAPSDAYIRSLQTTVGQLTVLNNNHVDTINNFFRRFA